MKALTAIKLAAIAAAFAIASQSRASDVPVSAMEPGQQAYATASEAATAALAVSARLSRIVEYAGAVYYSEGVYHYTIPVTTGKTAEFNVRLQVPRSALVALYHTHPTDAERDRSEYFSVVDVDVAKGMGLTSYIGVIKTGDVRAFDPKHDETRPVNGSDRMGPRIADGRKVGGLAS